MIEVIAQRSPTEFLVAIGDGMALVIDLDEMRAVGPAATIDAILGRGYWEKVTDGRAADRALTLVRSGMH